MNPSSRPDDSHGGGTGAAGSSGPSGAAALYERVRKCTLCEPHLPLGARPILQLDPRARVLIAGQAPGRRTHASGVPFDDASGDRLRQWLGLDRDAFYDPARVAILPMGLCYPGRAGGGDAPPRPECAAQWRRPLLDTLPGIRLTLVIGAHAQHWHLPDDRRTLTERVAQWQEAWPVRVCLPHPSPRNQHWCRRNPWFEATLLPALRARVAQVMSATPDG